ncbi:MAG TPA: DNA-directed RNA polymerase subunit L [Methanocella sp.]|nr:DNA-directed RNA polymerase subunit L [Methanocella sp.]
MDVKVLRKTDTEIEVEIKGEDHTLLNALKSSLLKDNAVKVATYDIEYPGISNPVLYVRTARSEDPIDAIKKASADLAGECNTFIELFSKKAKAKAKA